MRRTAVPLYLLFFCSGVSGLLYQLVWVRAFGAVFGNTIHSASLVVAVFMLGLGLGSYAVGVWADRRYARAPESLLRAYGQVELLIAGLGLAVSAVLPTLGPLTARVSSYVVDGTGWFVVAPVSYVWRGGIALVLLTPITVLMGGTLTLLIRHRVRLEGTGSGAGSRGVALLYAANTFGAAAGAFLTDFLLVPRLGLWSTQLVAVGLNVLAGVGALILSRRAAARAPDSPGDPSVPAVRRGDPSGSPWEDVRAPVAWTALALALSGCAAMGLEIVWLRHFTLLLGGFRAVFALVLTVMLVGIGLGSLLGGILDRRTHAPAQALMIVQALFVVSVLAGIGAADAASLAAAALAFDASVRDVSPLGRWAIDVWYNLRPILLEAGLPSLLMGCSFPLANGVIQHAEQVVGRRAGALYLANTAGSVCGALLAGYVLLPVLGIQTSVTWLAVMAALAIVPLYLTTPAARAVALPAGASMLVAAGAIAVWFALPSNHVLAHAMTAQAGGERLVAMSEGLTEIVSVTEVPGRGRGLITNGHAMSSTAPLDQRYMRALAHVPLLAMERPTRVLVIGFGVGNTTHAATLHPSVERVEVADLSRQVLDHAGYFRDANRDVLRDPRVTVFVNDGRQHLQMQAEATYDLITLEPPPIAHAGVASLYARDFYALARSRLKPGGYISQWLPAYQVPAETSLAMVRAFVDVFPQSVLLSGAQAELLLVGTRGERIELDPDRVMHALAAAPAVQADLRQVDLGSVTEIAGMFVGSAATMTRATSGVDAVSDDRPLQEYGVRSVIGEELRGVPAQLFDLSAAAAWCPRCFREGEPTVAGLDTYLSLLDQAYRAPVAELAPAASVAGGRRVLGSAYLGAVVPDTDAVHNLIGVSLLREGKYPEAADAFRRALARRADSADAHRNLGTALTEVGQIPEALDHLRRAVQLDPANGGAQLELGSLLLQHGEWADAAAHLRAAVQAMPGSAAAHNDLGVALASMGDLPQAIAHFEQAVTLDPQFAEGRRNLDAALRVRRR